MSVEIYYLYNTELDDLEYEMRGFKRDVFVRVDGELFNLNFYTIDRINSDYENMLNNGYNYHNEENIVIIKEISRKEIKEEVQRLYKQRYFEKIKGYKKVGKNIYQENANPELFQIEIKEDGTIIGRHLNSAFWTEEDYGGRI